MLQQKTVTQDGVADLGRCQSDSYSYKVDGTFGGGNLEVGYISTGGDFVRYDAIVAAVAATQGVITCGVDSSVAFKLSGATAPTVYIQVNPV